MIPRLPSVFLEVPIAHRALHDNAQGRPENSRAAIRAAIAAGYGIEIDLQPSADGRALVFHDYFLDRLTAREGRVDHLSAEEAGETALSHGDGEGIPTLTEILEIVNGRVPLLIELKDQDGFMGRNIGRLEADAARVLANYDGPVAVMSFNPHTVAEMARIAPRLPRGLVTCNYDPRQWHLPAEICDRLRGIPDFASSLAAFISHRVTDLDRPRVTQLHDEGVPVLCWTVRSQAVELEARKRADNITFEGYLADIPA
ncbi:glycerophosphodiester phosphodiesterase family protein [Jhaorihella thermophila]|uniref:Glycerophosphoryl diester phosphodiesterase n=1 Tax=Jhaorihella thermophila TaxID=488547 RepID=A0A1H5YAG6_9RHOB|nr:glycerophosphodiester phosphodiesterase family protein [Jhaorihella thermophila]SEG20637.1 Glycerophosphoryl diester phosphodiesterase [Jhaorihella thermophila]